MNRQSISPEVKCALEKLPTPCYVVDLNKLEDNLRLLNSIEKQCKCKILLAQKAFSTFATYPLIKKYISGVTSSGLFEARLGFEEMGIDAEIHTFSPAYHADEFEEIAKYSDHIVFNSINQWEKYKDICKKRGISCGIRINPEYSEIETDIYNPCFFGSRFGVKIEDFSMERMKGIDGIHFHTMCEEGADTLERTLTVIEEKFGEYLHCFKWINFGGGHHITKDGYDIQKLIKCINYIKSKYDLEVYLEPGEAIALDAGWLVSTVLDTMKNNGDIAILDVSAACHMPDVLEMPYRPDIICSAEAGQKKHTYKLGGPTCLAGDVIGEYSFDKPLAQGSKLIFCDMAIYSMVKNNTFNGVNLPKIALLQKENSKITTKVIKTFGYDDFKNRLS